MGAIPRVVIVRNDRESPKKCSLTPVREREDLTFLLHKSERILEIGEATLLHPDGEPLTAADGARPLLLVDASWRRLRRVLMDLRGAFVRRSLPAQLGTAYPRRSSTFDDPTAGLASIEALHAALAILGRRDDTLLDGYLWKDAFLSRNAAFFASLPSVEDDAPSG
ncbi:MAG: DUF367 domain-containing protein [Planctomycetes bacterium]|nr:DUF367 domain-containing protein [Planctomycetota bacterium]